MRGRFTVYRDVKLASETSSNGINSSHHFIRFRHDDLCYLRSRTEGKMTSLSISVLRNYNIQVLALVFLSRGFSPM